MVSAVLLAAVGDDHRPKISVATVRIATATTIKATHIAAALAANRPPDPAAPRLDLRA